MQQATADTGGSGEGSPGKFTGVINNKEKGKSNLHSETRVDKEVCYSWNDEQGKFADVAPGKSCPSGRAHVGQRCLSDGAPFGGVPAVGRGSAVILTGVQGDEAASHSCPNVEIDCIVEEAQSKVEKIISRGAAWRRAACRYSRWSVSAASATFWCGSSLQSCRVGQGRRDEALRGARSL